METRPFGTRQGRISRALLSFAVGGAWALAVALVVGVAPASATSSWVVNSADDTGGDCTSSKCTLRAAIRAANLSAGDDAITFNIAPSGPKTISVGAGLDSQLPAVSGSDIVIDATTQPGGGAHGIRLDDPDVGGAEHGLVLEGNRITVRGFAITRFDARGILVWGGSSEVIQGNWIGTSDGVTDQGTVDDGIRLNGGGSSLIGGSAGGEGNLISGSDDDGIQINDSNNNTVSGNMVGLTADGLQRLPNRSTGIELTGTSSYNRIGGLSPGERNYASGNNGIGVQMLGIVQADGSCKAPEYNVVQGNYLGLDANGGRISPSGNRGEGIALHVCAHHNTIGGTTAAARNIVSGNAADGVELDSTGGPGGTLGVCDNTVQGNFIGLDPSGLSRRDNFDDGVGLDNGSCNNLVGGSEAGARNFIAGNSNDGVDISHRGSNGNLVENNVIGLNVNNAAVHNGYYGVMFRSKPQRNVIKNNVISGNAQGGVRMQDDLTYYNEIRGNQIGTDISGTQARANSGRGIWLFDGPSGNLITGNSIMYNSGAGVAVERSSASTVATRENRITDNRMRANGGLGIDLLPAAGVNPLDGANNDAQIGNGGIDSPVIGRATAAGVSGTAPPNASVEVFQASPDAGETNGEGSSLIDTVTADTGGQWCLAQSGLTGTVTATATDPAGNTSEFAANAAVSGDGAACGADTTSPTVGSVAPADGATGIASAGNVTATFSEAMDASTINASTFTLAKQGTGTPLSAQIGYDAASRKATLDPGSDLEPNATYMATLEGGTGGIKDAAGNPLAADKTWSFTTAPRDATPLFADDFTAPDGSSPTNWAVNRSAGGTGAGATIQGNALREDVILSSAQDGITQYVQARATTLQPDWSAKPVDITWQMQTDASSSQTIGAFLSPQALTGNVSNASDYLRVRVTNGQLAVLRRTAGGSPTTIWSGPVTRGSTLRQFELQLDGTNLWLYEGAVGSSPTLRVGPIPHGLTWTSGNLYLHAHNSSAAMPYQARFDTVRIYDR